MATDPDQDNMIRQLFAELNAACARAAAAVPTGRPPFLGPSAFVLESRKATEIIARIRTLAAEGGPASSN